MVFNTLRKLTKQFINKDSPRLRESIKMHQSKNKLYINGKLRKPIYQVIQLGFKNRETNTFYNVDVEEGSNTFDTTIDIYELISKLQLDGVYDLYIIVKVPEYQFGEKRKRTLEETAEKSTNELGEKCFIYPIRLGRFSHTDVFGLTPGVTPDGNSYNFYKTIKGNISLAINHEVSQKRKMQIDHLYSKGHELEFGGKLFTRNSEI